MSKGLWQQLSEEYKVPDYGRYKTLTNEDILKAFRDTWYKPLKKKRIRRKMKKHGKTI